MITISRDRKRFPFFISFFLLKFTFTFADTFGNLKMMKKLWEENEQEMDVGMNSYKTIEKESLCVNLDKLTPIQKFYHGESVLITGGSGFLGKLLIEKLLRGCPGIKCIYLLMRSKKGKNVSQRTDEIVENVVSFIYLFILFSLCQLFTFYRLLGKKNVEQPPTKVEQPLTQFIPN